MAATSLSGVIADLRLSPHVVTATDSWDADELLRFSRTWSMCRPCRKKNVAVRLSDPARLALSLVALDGVASRLLLLSASLSDHESGRLLADFRPDIVISDAPGGHHPGASHLPWEPVLSEEGHGAEHDQRTEWVLATSGTTGTPKLVLHTLSSLMRTTKVGGDRALRWGQLFDICRFAGLQVFLQGLLGGEVLLLTAPSSPLAERLKFLRGSRCEALSATPTLWRKILMTMEDQSWPLRQITLGGEIADAATLNALKTRFPDARITHIYASTEAGVGFAVTDGLPGFPSSWLGGEDGLRMRVAEGRLFLASAGGKYLRSPEDLYDAEGFMDTGDAVQIVGDRCIFLGRANGTINVGGNKLFPEEVESVLLEVGEISLARVMARSSPIMGQIVFAEVVPRDPAADPKLIRQLAIAHCISRLDRWKVPAMLQVRQALEDNSGGKLSRRVP